MNAWIWVFVGVAAYITFVSAVLCVFKVGARADEWARVDWHEYEARRRRALLKRMP